MQLIVSGNPVSNRNHKKWKDRGSLPGDRFNLQFCISQVIKWGNHTNTDDNYTNVSKLTDEAKRTGCRIVAYRPSTHPKG